MILDPDAYIPDAGFFPDQRTDGPTDEQGDSRSWMNVSMMHVSMMGVPILHVRKMYLRMMHIPMMQITMIFLILIDESIMHVSMMYIHDACSHDAFIPVPVSTCNQGWGSSRCLHPR